MRQGKTSAATAFAVALTSFWLLASTGARAAVPETWDANADFSVASNPNGPWSYLENGTPLPQSIPRFEKQGLEAWWSGDAVPNSLVVVKNKTETRINFSNTVKAWPGLLVLDPESQTVAVAFTAPTAGTYSIRGQFTGADGGQNAHPVSIVDGDNTLWTNTISMYGQSDPFDLQVTMAAGEVINFNVETSTLECTYCYLSTGFEAVIAQIKYFYNSATLFVPPGTNATAASGDFSIEAPVLDPSDYHSLAELAVESTNQQQRVEIGWTVDPLLNNGDATNPHLFVHYWVNGEPGCYNDGCGFVPVSDTVMAGMALTPGTTTTFRIKYMNGDWWVRALGEWVGYFPGSLWSNGFINAQRAQWSGEVAASSAKPKTQMGNGILGTASGSATIDNLFVVDSSNENPSLNPQQTDKSLYAIGTLKYESFSYGGPGDP